MTEKFQDHEAGTLNEANTALPRTGAGRPGKPQNNLEITPAL
jgi:hypothetical protein